MYGPTWRSSLRPCRDRLENALHTRCIRIRTLVSDELIDRHEDTGPLGCVQHDTRVFQGPLSGLDRDLEPGLVNGSEVPLGADVEVETEHLAKRPETVDRRYPPATHVADELTAPDGFERSLSRVQ